MPIQKMPLEEAKQIILERINSNIDYRTLQKELKGVTRKNIKLLVLEIMDEQKLSEIPFAGMMRKPKKATPPLLINADGMIDVKDILAMKEFAPETCIVKYSVSQKKITLTIKEKK